jgi:hypothetical protein
MSTTSTSSNYYGYLEALPFFLGHETKKEIFFFLLVTDYKSSENIVKIKKFLLFLIRIDISH